MNDVVGWRIEQEDALVINIIYLFIFYFITFFNMLNVMRILLVAYVYFSSNLSIGKVSVD